MAVIIPYFNPSIVSPPWTLPIEYFSPDPNPKQSATLTLTATASWLRSGLVGAIQQAAQPKGLIAWDRAQSFRSNDIKKKKKKKKRDTTAEDDPADSINGPEGHVRCGIFHDLLWAADFKNSVCRYGTYRYGG